MIAYENEDKSALVFIGDVVLFACGICGESHQIDKRDVNETVDKTGYTIICPVTGQGVEFDKAKVCVV